MKKYSRIAIVFACAVVVGLANQASAAEASCVVLSTNLAVGTTDHAGNGPVRQLQDFLRAEGHLDHVSTGYFGTLTSKAVASFQAQNGIEAIGAVGPKTRAAIQKKSCAASVGTIPTNAPLAIAVPSVTAETATPASATAKLPYESKSFAGWQGVWGSVANTPTGLSMQASSETTGAQAVLNESIAWSDYRYTANVTASNGDVTLIGRYVDENNYLACNFSRNNLAIIERKNGTNTTVEVAAVEGMSSAQYFFKNMTIAMRVQGPTIGCTAVGSTDNIKHTFTDLPRKGGIGIQTWNPNKGVTTLEVRSVNVEEL